VKQGNVFVFSIGLVHFELNVKYGNVIAIVSLSSQNSIIVIVENPLFKVVPSIFVEVLA